MQTNHTEELDVSDKADKALLVAGGSFDWYRTAAIRSRRAHRTAECALIALSAAIPVSVVVAPGAGLLQATLGGAIAIIAGCRSVFNWNENYLRFTRAREAVEAERRKYQFGIAPYTTSVDREQLLVERVTDIEQEEMGGWLSLKASTNQENP